MDSLLYLSFSLVIFLFVSLYRIWQLSIAKNSLSNELKHTKSEIIYYKNIINEKNLELRTFTEKTSLGERLDAINNKLGLIENLSSNVNNIQKIFGSKQHRGLFGEHKLLDILSDELNSNQYSSQYVLTNNTRPDIVIHLPSQPDLLAIDAKFPYESFKAIKESEALNEKQHKEIYHKAFISDMKKHIKDIANKYIIPDQTQDFALLFVPAESIFTYIAEDCSEVQILAASHKVILCTPNILMLVIRIIKSLNKDHQIQVHARSIQEQVMKLTGEVAKLSERNKKLQKHFAQGVEDLEIINKITNKIDKNITKITNIEVEADNNIFLNINNNLSIN